MTDSTFAGRPINGTLTTSPTYSVEQRPTEEFVAALDALLEYPDVEAVQWDQYTPYFNDGDPCVFRTGEVLIKFTFTSDGDGDYEDGFIDTYSLRHRVGNDYKNYTWSYMGHDLTEAGALVEAFTTAVGYGAHNVALQKIFGDHAQVTATSEGFDVEFYEHD